MVYMSNVRGFKKQEKHYLLRVFMFAGDTLLVLYQSVKLSKAFGL